MHPSRRSRRTIQVLRWVWLPPEVPRNKNVNSEIAPTGQATAGAGDTGLPVVSANKAAIARFFAAAQNDFAVRLKWSVTPKLGDANHEPKVRIKGPLEIFVPRGSTVRLEGEVSDPDHDAVKVIWWQDNAACTYPGDLQLSDRAALNTTFRVPKDGEPGQTIHVILEATDNGTPPLTRYQRGTACAERG
jgi:cellulose-binding protein